jgi:diguanylate cyclase (GGDEF)-like protein
MINGTPFIVSASLIQPDFGTVRPAQPRAPVVVTAMPIDAVTLATFGRRYQIDGLHIAATPSATGGVTQVQLRDAAGRPVAWLVWNDAARGQSLMIEFLVPFTVLSILLAAISRLLFRRSEAVATDLIASEARARHLAYHDTLTQLPNRAMMFERVRMALAISRRSGASLAVHFLDLDRFKEVNDALGHLAGDELIRWTAARLTALCRETDTVARLGGDEFIIVQVDTGVAGASLLAERILAAFRSPIELEYGVVEIGLSIGVTMITNPAIDPVEVLRQADLALYASKENGRNCVTFFEPEMDAAVRMRRGLEKDLRKALQAGDLEMVYQTQIDQRGNVSGLEALVRWKHPELGMVAPAMFIPLAEESGLILELGEFVFRRVFEETRSWKKRVAINVSALQLRSPTFMPGLNRLVGEFGINTGDYEIEITETALLGDDGVTRNNIMMLKQAGFTIALDDFGTGYSSLSTLQRFAVDKIKIDRSFVRNLAASDEADALIDAIIQLGRALKLEIVAEGVETEIQRDRLAACGCTVFQGFLLSQPINAPAVRQLALKGLSD